MKYWQKIYLATLVLFLVALNVGAFLLFDTSWQSALASERQRGFSEHGFISDNLKEDITAILLRDDVSGDAVSSLYRTYSQYYYAQGTFIALQNSAGTRDTNNPSLASAPSAPVDGSLASKIAVSNGVPYLYVSGRVGDTGYWLVTARSVAAFLERTNALSQILILGSIGISVLLAVALFFILKGFTSPIHKLSVAASLLAEGDYAVRAGVRGRDELSELARRFNGMADKIQSQIHELREEAERKQRFIDDLAHEMRTPLTAIGGYAQYLTAAAITEDERLSALEYIPAKAQGSPNSPGNC
jgi:signal transduction histidine kinase